MSAGGGSTIARLRFEFLGDLKGYRESLTTAKTEGNAAAKTLGQAFRDAIGKAPAAGWLGGLKQDLELGRSKTLILRDAASSLRKELASLSVKALHTGLNGLKSVLGSLKTAAGEVFKGLLIGTGIAAFQDLTRIVSDLVHVIPNLIGRGQEYARTIDKISDATGASAEASSMLVATLGFLGETTGNVAVIFSQLARNLPDNEAKLNALGVTTRDVNGQMLDAVTIIDNVRSTLSRSTDGFAKMTQVIELFGGRGAIGKLAEYLQLTDRQMAILTAHFQETGQILSREQTRIAEDAERESNNIQGILTGLGATLMTIVGPQIIAFFSNVARVITDNAKQIEQAIGSALSFIFGMISGLAGWSGAAATLTGLLGGIGGASNSTALSIATLEDELAGLEEKDRKAAGGTKAATDAIQGQIKAVEKEREALDRLVKAQDRVYQARLRSIRSLIDERLAQLDAAEAARELADRQRDLNERLNEAQIALAQAQAGTNGSVNAEAVSSAMAEVADIQRQQADLARQQEVSAQRKSLTDAQAYIDNVAKLVEDAENRKAVAKTLGRKKTALEEALAAAQERKDAEAIATLTAELEAVKTGIEQNAVRQRSDAEAAELEAKKQRLQDYASAVRSTSANVNAQREADIRAELKRLRELAEAEEINAAATKARLAEIKAGYSRIYGEDGSLATEAPSAFETARLAGIKFADDVKAALIGPGGLLDGIKAVADALSHILDGLIKIWNSIPDPLRGIVVGAIAGAPGGIPGMLIGSSLGGAAQLAGQAAGSQTEQQGLIAQTRAFIPQANLAELRAGLQAAQQGLLDLANMPFTAVERVAAQKTLREVIALLQAAIARAAIGGHAAGGIVGARGTELGRFGEQGVEFVLNNRVLGALANLNRSPVQALAAVSAGQGSGVIEFHSHLHLDGREIAESVDRWQDTRRRT